MKKKPEKVNPILGRTGQVIDLTKFNVKDEKEQYLEIENILKDIYQDNLNVSRKHVLKCLRLTWSINDNFIFLPHNLRVSKEKLSLKFEVKPKKKVTLGIIIFSVWLLIFTIIASTYAGFSYLSRASLNKDIDGDGIPDINIDINADGIADINIDIDGDNIPDVNIDYKGNRRAVFNVDTNGDGVSDTNFVNDATNGKKCSINCDLDGDGWPDINLDLDGDGIPDIDVDTDLDGIPDLNLDLDGDGVCDLMCDTDGDGVCDTKCIKAPEYEEEDKQTGSSVYTGQGNVEAATPYLLINYNDGVTVNVKGLLPDDQQPIPGYEVEKPMKEFTIENLSDYPIYYAIKWNVKSNTFVTNNLEYNIKGTNGAPSISARSIPKKSVQIVDKILIMPRVSQKFKVEINLKGTGTPQNEDQGKQFIGQIDIELEPTT